MSEYIKIIRGNRAALLASVVGVLAVIGLCCASLFLVLPSGEAPAEIETVPRATVPATERPQPTETPITPTPLPPSPLPPADTPLPTDTATAEPTATPLPETDTPGPESPASVTGTVVNIVDGDTIDVEINGEVYRLRYIGIDTPERGAPFFGEAAQANSDLVLGRTVTLIKDVSETDRFGRLLRYVFLEDGTFVNAELVSRGYAVASTFPPDVAYQDLFREKEQEARSAGRGLWAPPTSTPVPTLQPTSPPPPPATLAPTLPPPPPTLQPTQPPAEPTQPPQQNCDPAYPDVCIPSPPPDLDCKDIPYRRFRVLPPDPHRFDGDNDGIGCESG